MTITSYERTHAEFREAFQYGKMFYVRKVIWPPNYVQISRMYLLKDGTYRIMPTMKFKFVEGVPRGFSMEDGDKLFEDAEGNLSIMREKKKDATV